MQQVLQAVHASGVLHTDVHPRNWVVRHTGGFCLVDWARACPLRDRGEDAQADAESECRQATINLRLACYDLNLALPTAS